MLRAWLDWPALLTRMSTPPNVFTAHTPSSRASWGFVRSHFLLASVPLSLWFLEPTCSCGSFRRPSEATRPYTSLSALGWCGQTHIRIQHTFTAYTCTLV